MRCLLDEFANIGQIPNFDKLIATIRSREISASIILQSQSQLKTIYKDAADTIVGNCDTTLFLGGKEKSTLKEISELLGKETIDSFNQSENRGSQVSHGLNYAKPRNAINTHCKGALKRGALTEGGVQELTFIPEGDVYRLIVHSRLPGAERFEKWVFDEVLPMIRKTGGYMTASLLEQAAEKPEILLAFADQLLAEHEKNRQLSGEVERLRPKADFYDAFVHEENCTNIRATAKELQIGERAFCRFLMDAGFLYRCPAGYLLPYAKPSNGGLFRVKDFWKYGHFGQQTLITPQGKNVIRLLLDDGQMRLEWKERMG